MTTTKPARLTPELEAEIRSELPEVPRYIADYLRPLLAEIDALRAERNEARAQLEARLREPIPVLRLEQPPPLPHCDIADHIRALAEQVKPCSRLPR